MRISKANSLILQDLKKIGVGALIAGAGAGITYLIDGLGGFDFGQYTYIIIPIISVVLNAIRKYLSETKYPY